MSYYYGRRWYVVGFIYVKWSVNRKTFEIFNVQFSNIRLSIKFRFRYYRDSRNWLWCPDIICNISFLTESWSKYCSNDKLQRVLQTKIVTLNKRLEDIHVIRYKKVEIFPNVSRERLQLKLFFSKLVFVVSTS